AEQQEKWANEKQALENQRDEDLSQVHRSLHSVVQHFSDQGSAEHENQLHDMLTKMETRVHEHHSTRVLSQEEKDKTIKELIQEIKEMKREQQQKQDREKYTPESSTIGAQPKGKQTRWWFHKSSPTEDVDEDIITEIFLPLKEMKTRIHIYGYQLLKKLNFIITGMMKKEVAKELMVSMQESAVHWWDALDDATKGSYKAAKTAFVAYFGGGQEVTATALTELANMHQGSKSMVSFGARVKVTLAKIDTTMKEYLKLFFFASLVHPQVAKEVSRYNPTTLNDAIGYAIKLEIHDRNTANHHNLLHKKTMGLSPNIPHFQSTISDMTEPTPMEDVQATNSPRYKQHYKNNSSNSRPSYSNNNFTHSKKQQPQQQQQQKNKKGCYHCGRKNHFIKECWFAPHSQSQNKHQQIKQQHHQKNYQRQPYHRNNIQKETQNDNNEQDYQPNLFDYLMLHQNVQLKSAAEDDSPTRFSVEALVGTLKTKLLIDLGAEITSMDEATVKAAGLQLKSAQPMLLQYENSSKEVSQYKTSTMVQISQHAWPITFRVVKQQNTPILIGMDWMLGKSLLLDVDNKKVLSKEQVFFKINAVLNTVKLPEAIPDDVKQILLSMPSLFDKTPQQTITNAPIVHVIFGYFNKSRK
ncbi:hypothetical protein INT45_006020, partial [Circinella minor]